MASGGGLAATGEIEEVEMEIQGKSEEEADEWMGAKRARVSPKAKGSGKGLYGVTTAEKKTLLKIHNDEKLLNKAGNGNLVRLNVGGTSKREGHNMCGTHGSQTLPGSNALRSPSPGGDLKNKTKRAVRICAFFAQGRCIKGKKCKFLHHRGGSGSDNQWSKEEKAGLLAPVGYGNHRGSPEGSQPQNLSNLKEPQFMNSDFSSKDELRTAPVHSYGKENEGLTHILDNPTLKVSQEKFSRIDDTLAKRPTNPVNGLGKIPVVQEKNHEPYCIGSHLGVISDSFVDCRGTFPGMYLGRGKQQSDVTKVNSLSDSHASKTYLEVDSLNPDYQHRSNESSISSDTLQRWEKSSVYGGKTENLPPWHQEVHYRGCGSYGLHTLQGLRNPGVDSSVHSLGSPPLRATSHLGMSSLHQFTPSLEKVGLHENVGFDKGFYPSSLESLVGSLPHYSKSNTEGIDRQSFAVSPRCLSPIEDKVWVTSVPFVPSFNFRDNKSPPRSQYDPLVDSFDPSKLGSTNNDKSLVNISYSMSSQHTNENAVVGGSKAGHNAEKSLTYDGKLNRNMSAKGSNEFASLMASNRARSSSLDGENWVTQMKAGDSKNEAASDNEKTTRDFHFRLVDYVKELVKPFWKEGYLTKDSHKVVVKKSVEKVLASFEPHQVPATEELINNYMTVSQSKIEKLVKAYVDKHCTP